MEPRYNEVLGTMKITLLYQVSHYIRVKKQRNIKSWDPQNYLVIRGFVISDLFITRFHCTNIAANVTHVNGLFLYSHICNAMQMVNYLFYALMEDFSSLTSTPRAGRGVFHKESC